MNKSHKFPADFCPAFFFPIRYFNFPFQVVEPDEEMSEQYSEQYADSAEGKRELPDTIGNQKRGVENDTDNNHNPADISGTEKRGINDVAAPTGNSTDRKANVHDFIGNAAKNIRQSDNLRKDTPVENKPESHDFVANVAYEKQQNEGFFTNVADKKQVNHDAVENVPDKNVETKKSGDAIFNVADEKQESNDFDVVPEENEFVHKRLPFFH